MLEAINLGYEYDGRYLFNGLHFSLGQGQLLLITGANGSGKTTLLKILAGLILPAEGDIGWQQQAIHHDRCRFNVDLLYLGHRTGIAPLLTPFENLHFLQNLSLPASAADITEALTAVGLAAHIHTPCYLLSAGQQRRAALARLWLTKAKLWILDEPLTALDQQGIALIEQHLLRHLQQKGMLILTSHQPLLFPGVVPLEIKLS